MPAIVYSVEADSIAEDLEISQNDEVISINEIKPQDLIDYKFLSCAEDISLHIKRSNGEEEIIDIEKDAEEDLGINFESAVFDKILPCTNKCVFCFVDQQPKGLRKSLYVKDDDYRLSYLQGTYVTLTNLTQKQRTRIETMGLGPLYVSVHSTNPKLRAYMLNNPKAKNIINDLKWLNKVDIPIHVQIVLCPDINDKEELDRTLNDLAVFKSNILSIAVVPVGITKYRDGDVLKKVTKEKALEVINQVYEFNKKLGYNMAFPSDEFFLLAGMEFPGSEFYNGFGQLDDGVGVCNLLIDDFNKRINSLPDKISAPKNLTIATGQLACNALKPIISRLNKIQNLNIDLIPIKSNFWGENVTVAGLITGQDLIDNLLHIKNKVNNLIIPSVMLRKYSDEFLDSLKLSDVENNLNTNVTVIENYYSNDELIDLIIT